jgi:hypothetical protein
LWDSTLYSGCFAKSHCGPGCHTTVPFKTNSSERAVVTTNRCTTNRCTTNRCTTNRCITNRCKRKGPRNRHARSKLEPSIHPLQKAKIYALMEFNGIYSIFDSCRDKKWRRSDESFGTSFGGPVLGPLSHYGRASLGRCPGFRHPMGGSLDSESPQRKRLSGCLSLIKIAEFEAEVCRTTRVGFTSIPARTAHLIVIRGSNRDSGYCKDAVTAIKASSSKVSSLLKLTSQSMRSSSCECRPSVVCFAFTFAVIF